MMLSPVFCDMSGLKSYILFHNISLQPGCSMIKQKLSRRKPEWNVKIEEEIIKQLEMGFIKVAYYLEWLANVVPVPKKDDKIRTIETYMSSHYHVLMF